MGVEALRDIVRRGLGRNDAERLSGIIGAARVDDNRFVLPYGQTYFQGYEVRGLSPFSNMKDLVGFLQSLGKKASELGFETLSIREEEGPSYNHHYGLLPRTHSDYSAILDLRKRGTAQALDEWTILVSNTGEVDSSYGRFGSSPITGHGRRRFMDRVAALARILPSPAAVA